MNCWNTTFWGLFRSRRKLDKRPFLNAYSKQHTLFILLFLHFTNFLHSSYYAEFFSERIKAIKLWKFDVKISKNLNFWLTSKLKKQSKLHNLVSNHHIINHLPWKCSEKCCIYSQITESHADEPKMPFSGVEGNVTVRVGWGQGLKQCHLVGLMGMICALSFTAQQ